MVAARKAPSGDEVQQALKVLDLLSPLSGGEPSDPRTIDVYHADKRVSVIIPGAAFDHFMELLAQMANGNAVTIVPLHAQLTTQEAADILNVSRPYLVALLAEGKLPFHKTGTHRRIKAADLFAYQQDLQARTKAAADELAQQAQELDLGY